MVSELEAKVKEERRNFSVTSRSMIAVAKEKYAPANLFLRNIS